MWDRLASYLGNEMDAPIEEIILVDATDREIGRAEKLAAHRSGALHRAVSVCVIDGKGKMLLQRRAPGKYHSAGLWTNACCSHPRPDEPVDKAALRRLEEEMGFTCPLIWKARTRYRAEVDPDLIENEVVHLFVGEYEGDVSPNPDEVDAFRWTTRDALLLDISQRPAAYTYWFKHYIDVFGDGLFRLPKL